MREGVIRVCKKCLEEVEEADYGFVKLYMCGFCGFMREKDTMTVDYLKLRKLRNKRGEEDDGLF